MMNERAYDRDYEGSYSRDYYRNCTRSHGRTSGGDGRGNCGGNPGKTERLNFYQAYQVPLMILGSFLSGILLIIGALA